MANKVIPFPTPAVEDCDLDHPGMVKECLNDLGNLVTLMSAVKDGNHLSGARDYLVREMASHHMALSELLFPDGM